MLIEFYLDGCGCGHQGFVDYKGELSKRIGVVSIFLLIQSKCEARAASAGCHVDTNGQDILIFKLSLKLFLSGLGQFKHGFLLFGNSWLPRKFRFGVCQTGSDVFFNRLSFLIFCSHR